MNRSTSSSVTLNTILQAWKTIQTNNAISLSEIVGDQLLYVPDVHSIAELAHELNLAITEEEGGRRGHLRDLEIRVFPNAGVVIGSRAAWKRLDGPWSQTLPLFHDKEDPLTTFTPYLWYS